MNADDDVGCPLDGERGYGLQLHNGRMFYPRDPDPDAIDIETIAHSLSKLCRYGGHVDKFLSVAEHSVVVSQIVPDEHALWGLLHDASEGLGLVDVPRGLKLMLPTYAELENRVQKAVAERFGLPWPIPEIVKQVDNIVLATEKRDLLQHTDEWPNLPEPWARTSFESPMSPTEAKDAFLNRYIKITGLTWST